MKEADLVGENEDVSCNITYTSGNNEMYLFLHDHNLPNKPFDNNICV